MDWETITKAVGAISAVGGGVVVLHKKLIRPMFNKFRQNYNNLQSIPDIVTTLDTIKGQLVPNGGGSLRDSIDRLESNQVIMGHKQGVLLNTSNIALVQTDPDGRVIDVTEPLCKLLGRSKDELLGGNWIAVIHPDDRHEVETEWDSAVEDRRNFEGHFRFSLNSGEALAVYMKMSPTPDYRGKAQGFIGTITKV